MIVFELHPRHTAKLGRSFGVLLYYGGNRGYQEFSKFSECRRIGLHHRVGAGPVLRKIKREVRRKPTESLVEKENYTIPSKMGDGIPEFVAHVGIWARSFDTRRCDRSHVCHKDVRDFYFLQDPGDNIGAARCVPSRLVSDNLNFRTCCCDLLRGSFQRRANRVEIGLLWRVSLP